MTSSIEKIRQMLSVESEKQEITWVFTGDSITQGGYHLFTNRDYVQLFEERLRFEMGRGYDIVIRTALSGWQTEKILDDIERRILRYKPNVLSIMLGMNDCAINRNISLKSFRDNYNKILDISSEKSNPALILHTPNPILSEEYEQRGRLEEYVEVIREIATQRQAVLVDHFDVWKRAVSNGHYLHVWLGDAIHPNNFGHLAFAKELFRCLDIYDECSGVCNFFTPLNRMQN